MKYFLAIDKRKRKNSDNSDRYIAIRWDRLEEYKDLDFLNLQDICSFTMSFKSKNEFIEEMIFRKLIDPKYKNSYLAIVYKEKGIYKKIDFDVPYKNEKKYFDYIYLTWYIKEKRDDLEFLRKLSKYFHSKLPYNNELYKVHPLYNPICCLDDYIIKYEDSIEIDENMYNQNIDFLLARFCTVYDKKNKTIKTEENGEIKINFRSLRDLAMFIINLERNKNKEKPLVRKKEKKTCTYFEQTCLF